MNLLQIESTKSTPEILFNSESHLLYINGQSYPENAYKFYEPLFEWIDQYIKTINNDIHVQMNIDLSYINTSSSKCLMMLLDKLDEGTNSGKNISLKWFCDLENESEVECAEEFTEDLSLPYEIKQRIE